MDKQWKMWNVSGSFIIPGTRDKVSFGPIRIGDFTMAKAAPHVSELLTEQFGRKLRNERHFTPGFVLGNLKWEPVTIQRVTD